MKKILFFAAFAAAVLCSCNKSEEALNTPAEAPLQTVHFTAGSVETKAIFGTPDGASYPVLWSENNADVALSVNGGNPKQVPVVISTDKKTAKFSYDVATAASYQFVVVNPYYALRSISSDKIRVEVPAGQTCTDTSPDEMAIVMADLLGPITEITNPVNMQMAHIPSYLHLIFNNVDLQGGKMQSVNIISNKKLSGRFYVKADKTCELDDAAMFGIVGIKPHSLENVWAGVFPADLSGETITLQIVTDQGVFVKDVTFGPNHQMESGKIYKISVDMADAVKQPAVPYTKVSSVADLNYGDEVIIVAETSNIALSTVQNKNNRSGASVSRNADGNIIYNPSSAVEILKLEDGLKPGQWALKATGTANPGYLYAADTDNSSNLLKTQTTISSAASWNISINDDANKTAVIAADLVNRHNLLRFNEDSNLFSAYGASTQQQKVCIYRKNGDAEPHFKATMPDNSRAVSGAEQTLPVYIFGNVAWTANVTGAGASLDKDSGTGNYTLSLTLDENTSTSDSREVTVTVTTTAEVATKTYTFTVTQNPSGGPVYFYNLTRPNIGTNGTYAGNCDIVIGGIEWNVTGVSNSTSYDGWRLGGSSITNTNRCIYSKTPISHEVVRVITKHSRMTITLNSFTLTVHKSASDAESGANPIASLTQTLNKGTQEAPATTTFTKTDDTSWAGCYYRLTYNVTNNTGSNKYVEFRGLEMWDTLAE